MFGLFLLKQIDTGEAQIALSQIAALRPVFGAFLNAALQRGLFAEAQALIEALDEYWEVAGLASEAQAWGDRVIKATELHPGVPPVIETPAHDLWLFATGSEGNRALHVGDLAKAERIYRQIAASFDGHRSDKALRSLSVSYYQLGTVAFVRGDLAEAESWVQQSLAIKEAMGNQAG